MPNSFYDTRGQLSNALAACVFWEPALCPSKQSLPRDLVTDSCLKKILGLSVLCRTPEDMAVEVCGVIGDWYAWKLLGLLGINHPSSMYPICEPQVFLWNVDWYADQLRRAEQLYQQHAATLESLAGINSQGSQEFFRT